MRLCRYVKGYREGKGEPARDIMELWAARIELSLCSNREKEILSYTVKDPLRIITKLRRASE